MAKKTATARPAPATASTAPVARKTPATPAKRPAAGRLGAPPARPKFKARTPTPTPAPRPAARAATPPPAATSSRIKVRALKMGYLGNERRRVGDVFVIDRKVFNPSWMVAVDPSVKIQRTTGKQELRRKHDEILSAKRAEQLGTSEHDVPDTGDNPLDAD